MDNKKTKNLNQTHTDSGNKSFRYTDEKQFARRPSIFDKLRAPVSEVFLIRAGNVLTVCFLMCSAFVLGMFFARSSQSLIRVENPASFDVSTASITNDDDEDFWNEMILGLAPFFDNPVPVSYDSDGRMELSKNHLDDKIPETPVKKEKKDQKDKKDKKYDIEHVDAFIASVNTKLSQSDRRKMAAALVKYSEMYKVPLHIAVGVAHAESHFNLGSVGPGTSSGRALGPMQVMYSVHHALLSKHGIKSAKALHDPDQGIKAGCLLLGRYIKSTGSVSAGLGKYLSRLSSDYILGKVMSSSLAFSSLKVGGISEQDIKQRIAAEKKILAKLK